MTRALVILLSGQEKQQTLTACKCQRDLGASD